MGQSQSHVEEQYRGGFPKINQLQLYKSLYDVRFGYIKVYNLNDGHGFAVKEHTFQKKKQWKAFLDYTRKWDYCPFLVQLLDLQYITLKGFCTKIIQTQSVYEYWDYHLERVIIERAESKQYFEEIEIVVMLYCILLAVEKLSYYSHGDIRPLTISVTKLFKNCPNKQDQPYPIYTLTDIQYLTDLNAYTRCITKQTGNYNLSPEQLQLLKENVLRPTYDTYDMNKSDVFSIGLTALQMATLNILNDVYNFHNYIIDTEMLDIYIREMKTRYSEKLCSIVCELLNLTPKDRPNSQKAHQLLFDYREKLEKYFDSLNIEKYNKNFKYQIQFTGVDLDGRFMKNFLDMLFSKNTKTSQNLINDYNQDSLYYSYHQETNYQKQDKNEFYIQQQVEYEDNQQKLIDQQLNPQNFKIIQQKPINYNPNPISKQQLLINTDQTKLNQQQLQYHHQVYSQPQQRYPQPLKNQQFPNQITRQQGTKLNYQQKQEHHLYSPYTIKQNIPQQFPNYFNPQPNVGIRLQQYNK